MYESLCVCNINIYNVVKNHDTVTKYVFFFAVSKITYKFALKKIYNTTKYDSHEKKVITIGILL